MTKVTGDPITIDLSDPTVFGPGHTLTPYGTALTGAVTFDPYTDLSATANAIDLGADNGLYDGEAVIYSKAAVPLLSSRQAAMITASANRRPEAVVSSQAQAQRPNVTVTGPTKAYIADSPSSNTHLEVKSLIVSADHTSRFDSQVNTIQASAVGFSGSWATNKDTLHCRSHHRRQCDITTQNLVVNAQNTTRKNIVDITDYNVKAGSGGVLQGNAAESKTDIANITHATIGSGAQIDVIGDTNNPGNFLVNAFNDVEGWDAVKLDSGGAIVGSGVTDIIRAATNDAIVSIGNNRPYHHHRRRRSPDPHAGSTHGPARGSHLRSRIGCGYGRRSYLRENEQVNVGTNAYIEARGEMNLLAGRTRDGGLNYITTTTHGDELNASAVPIDSLKSYGEISRTRT